MIIAKSRKLNYLERLYSRQFFRPAELGKDIEGSSPPSVFVGRYNYPNVFVGPLVPQAHGDTSYMDTPETWISKQAFDIIDFRFQLIRGKSLVNVHESSKYVASMREMALSKKSAEIEASFKSSPRGGYFQEETQPFGPSAYVEKIAVNVNKMEPHMERSYYDTDLKALDAILYLYSKGLFVSQIQKAFSIGSFGIEKNRRLVPTRWSITAVDDMLSKNLLGKIKQYQTIGEFRVYETENINNKFVVILMPTPWRYESMEAWFPQIIGDRLEIYSDYEYFDGKKEYACIGGCYYSARLAIAERLEEEKKQAGAILLREAYPGYIPLGVWNVRENVRDAMKKKYKGFETLNEALNYAGTRLRVPARQWIEQSHLLKNEFIQKKITSYL